MKRNSMFILSAFILFSAFSCGTNGSKTTSTDITEKKVIVQVPQFDADSAYKYIQAQVDFGPRTPNSKGHVACGDYLAAKLAEHGAKVISQNAELPAYDGTLLKARNIIGSFKPESKKRIALFAHWDTRPWADNDPNEKNHHTPILGANDGASGVGVLLEIARQSTNSNRNWESTSSFWMRKITEHLSFIQANIGKTSGVSAHNIGHEPRM